MYKSFFGFDKSPFAITPDPTFLFLSKQHREALAHLLYGMSGEGGFVQLTGEVGTGKTTLCRCLVEQAPEDVDIALILNPRQTAAELVASICEELRIELPQDIGSLKVLVDTLNHHLLSTYSKGRRTVLIIDEAQNLSPDTLEQVRLLTNLETNTRKLMRINLLGQPELKKLLSRPELRQLAQRITARYHLGPLLPRETVEYVRYRLKTAGCERPIFTQGALRLVHRLSGGSPRIINIICNRALLGAYAQQSERIDRRLVRSAYSEVMGRSGVFGFQRLSYWKAAGLLFIAIGSAWMILPSYTYNLDHFHAITDPSGSQGNEASKASQAPKYTVAPIPESRPPVVPLRITKNKDGAEVKFSRLLRANVLKTDEETAFTTLFRYWHLTYSELRGETACQRANTANLSCFSTTGNWGKLRQLNRPVILKLVDGGTLHHVVLVGLSDTETTLGFPDRKMRVPYEEMNRYWLGDFTLLWKPPQLSTGLLMKGLISRDVLWLREQLMRLQGNTEAFENSVGNNSFDEDLEKQVMNFQRSQGIKADGKVGKETLAHLTGLIGDQSVPVLWQEDTGRQGKNHVHNP